MLVSGAADGTVRSWDVKMGTPYEHNHDSPDPKRNKPNGKQQNDKKEMEKAKSATDMNKRKKGSIERFVLNISMYSSWATHLLLT